MRIVSLAAGLAATMALATGAWAAPVRVQGGLVEGTSGQGLRVYEGIPFAAPPLADLRWRPPRPARPWKGVKKTTAFAPACPQDQSFTASLGVPVLPTSEDCLYLNVWTPARSAKARLPVMVWIYGGGFTDGGAATPLYSGAHLARQGVVVVSIAYRLGALGFLAHPELSAESGGKGSGTYGLMDQIAALKWVRDNIAAFGGDPGRVTIFGESAGGMSVSMLTISPPAKGLFRGAISESGGSMAPAESDGQGGETVPTLKSAEAQGLRFLAKIGVRSIAEARKVPADKLVEASPGLGSFWPAMDGHILPGDAYSLYRARHFNDTPILVGANADEGALFVPSATAATWTPQVRRQYGAKADEVLGAYPPGDDARTLRSARDLMRDATFGWQTWAWARLQTDDGKGKDRAYVYYFTHHPPYPDLPIYRGVGAAHGAELAYVFGNLPSTATGADHKLMRMVMGYWVNFARTGDPNGPGLPVWPSYRDADPMALRLDTQAAPIAYPNLAKLRVLDDYYAWRRGREGPGD